MEKNAGRKKKALVLGGGGALGAYQCGVILCLAEKAIDFDAVIGTSIGSLNGALFSAGEQGRLRELWQTVRNRNFYRFNWSALPGLVAGRGAPLSNRPLRRFVEKFITPAVAQKIIDSPARLIITATCAVTGRRLTFRDFSSRKEIIDSLMGSMAIPGLFEPQKVAIGGKEYLVIDGGIRNDVPVVDAVEAGCEEIIAVPLQPAEYPEPLESLGWGKMIPRTIRLLLQGSREDRMDAACGMSEAIDSLRRLGNGLNFLLKKEIGSGEFDRLGLEGKISGIIAECRTFRGLDRLDIRIIRPRSPLGNSRGILRGILDFDPRKMGLFLTKGYEDAFKVLGSCEK